MEKQAPYLSFSDLRPGAASLLFRSAAEKNTGHMRVKTVQEHRDSITKLAEMRPALPNIQVLREEIAGVPCEWVYRGDFDNPKIIIYIHGGSWMTGNLKTARMPAELLAEGIDCRVLVVEYRLSPEYPFPSGLNDCYNVYKEIIAGGECSVALFGDSAGGNLSLALTHMLLASGHPLPHAIGLASPAVDASENSGFFKSGGDLLYTQNDGAEIDILSLYAGGNNRENPLISPVYGDLSEFPPMLIHVGGEEDFTLDCLAFAKKAYGQGADVSLKVYKEMFHDFSIVGVTLKESRESIHEFHRFFSDKLD